MLQLLKKHFYPKIDTSLTRRADYYKVLLYFLLKQDT